MGFFSDNFTFQPGLFHSEKDDSFDFQQELLNASIYATNKRRKGFKEQLEEERRKQYDSNTVTDFNKWLEPEPLFNNEPVAPENPFANYVFNDETPF